MPGTRLPKHFAPLALAALLCLPGCYARRPIASDPPPAKTAETAPAAAGPVSAPLTAEPAPLQEQPSLAGPEKAVADAAAAGAAAQAVRQHYVQIGAFGTEANAQGALAWLKGKGFEAARTVRVEQGQSVLFRVQAGPFQDLAAVHKALDSLKPDWPQAFIPGD